MLDGAEMQGLIFVEIGASAGAGDSVGWLPGRLFLVEATSSTRLSITLSIIEMIDIVLFVWRLLIGAFYTVLLWFV